MKSYLILTYLPQGGPAHRGGREAENKHVQRYGELFLTRGRGALAALAGVLNEFLMIPVHGSIKICIKRVLPDKALKTSSGNLFEILHIYFFQVCFFIWVPYFCFSPGV